MKIATNSPRTEPHVLQIFRDVWGNFRDLRGRDVCLDASGFFLEYLLPSPLWAWIILKVVKRFRWVKVILDGTLGTRYAGFSFLHRLWFKWSLSLVDEFIVPGPELRDWLVRKMGVRRKVHMVPCLLPLEYGGAKVTRSRKNHSWMKNRSKWLCSTGTFIPIYGFDQAALAVERIRRERRMDLGLVLLDGGFSRDEEYRRKVLEGREWIKVLEDTSRDVLLDIMKRCKVFIRPFAHESYGISRVEAIWCGVPAVVTRAGEIRGMLTFDFGDVEDLSGKILQAFSPETRKETLKWGKVFEAEADRNLQKIIELL